MDLYYYAFTERLSYETGTYGRNPYNDKITAITQSTAEGEANSNEIEYGANGLPAKVKCGDTILEYAYDAKGRKTEIKVNGKLQETNSYIDSYSYDEDTNEYSLGVQTRTLKTGSRDIILSVVKTGQPGDRDVIRKTETVSVGNTVLEKSEYNEKGLLSQRVYKTESNAARYALYSYDTYGKPINIKTKTTPSATTDVYAENYCYNEHGELTERKLTGDVTQTYTYNYNDGLYNVGFDNFLFKPLTDVNGRNTGREIYKLGKKFLGEHITYRKVGDHATNMPATVWFGSGEKIDESIKYKYDSCGNICQIGKNGHVIAKYAYDSLNRLIREDNKELGTTKIFTYDNAGNITERCEYPYTLKSGEELAELECQHYSFDYEGDKLLNYNGESFAYNSIGNPKEYRNKVVEWQYGTQLVKLGDTTFGYDGLGRRTSKNGIAFTYDNDDNLIKQSNGLEFIYDNAGVVGVKFDGAQYFYRKDAQGNIIAILDTNGEVVVKYVYDAWGNNIALNANGEELTSGIGVLNPFRYRGYYYDTETELYYLQTRYYDPEVGRFISQDSLEYADPEMINGIKTFTLIAAITP